MSFYSSSRPSSPPPTSQPLPIQKPVPDHATFAARQQKHIPPGIPVPVIAGSHAKTVRALAWSCNGTSVASGSDDRNVKIWTRRVTGINAFELAQPEPLLPHPTTVTPKPTTTSTNPITNLSFSPRRVDILAVASNDSSAGATGGKVVAVQGPASEEYDKAAEEAWGKEMAEGMKSRSRKVEPPKVEIWNVAKRQIITTIYLAHNPVFLAFHPSSKQLAIVCFDSRERNDYVVFAWQPRAVEEETDLVFEDEDISVEKSKREQEREVYRALLARQTQAAAAEAANTANNGTTTTAPPSGLKDEGWQIRTDIRLGEKNYRVSELNGAMFSPCGTRLYAGNHDGRINVWEYPIKRVDNSHEETVNGDDVTGEKEEGDVEMNDGNGVQQEKGDEGEDDDDAPMRRSNENRGAEEERTDTQGEPVIENAESTVNEGETETKMEMETQQVEETDGKTSNGEEQEDGEMAVEANIQKGETSKNSDAVDAEGDVEMEPASDEPTKPAETEKTQASDSQASPKTEDNPTEPVNNVTIAPTPAPQAPKPAPVPEAQMLKWLFGQVVNSGCLNCIDIDPRRRYVATGGSEGMVNLCDFKEWIGVASFDSYTEEVKSVKFSWDGEYIAAAGDDRCIDIMSTATGTTLHRIPTKGTVASLAWSPARHTLCYAVQGQGSSTDWYYVQM